MGTHGNEIREPAARIVVTVVPAEGRAVRRAAARLRPLARRYRGTVLEDKGTSISFHVRCLAPGLQHEALATARRLLNGGRERRMLRPSGGKKVWESHPRSSRGKRGAGQMLMRRWHGIRWRDRAFPIYIGDDRTDRSALAYVRSGGLAAWIPSEGIPDGAPFLLAGPREVERFLALLLRRIEQGGEGGTRRQAL